MPTIVEGDFEWDEAKARTNLAKHGVRFDEATTVFDDARAIEAPDFHDPARFVLIGRSRLSRVLFVARGARLLRNGENMKKRRPPKTSLARYDWSRAGRGRRAGRLRTAKVVLLRPEIYELFGSDEAINAALAAVAQLRDVVRPRKRRDRAA